MPQGAVSCFIRSVLPTCSMSLIADCHALSLIAKPAGNLRKSLNLMLMLHLRSLHRGTFPRPKPSTDPIARDSRANRMFFWTFSSNPRILYGHSSQPVSHGSELLFKSLRIEEWSVPSGVSYDADSEAPVPREEYDREITQHFRRRKTCRF